jgi:NADP-dependent alcohol dehydrogenase
MLNFTFFNPTKAVFGKGQLQELDNLVPEKATVLITYGGGSAKRNGVLDRVKDVVAKSGRTVLEFGGIEANPEFSTLMKAVAIVREKKVDFLLAVGGGSVMDGTKFIASASCADNFVGKEAELLTFGFGAVPVERSIPLGTVVTLPATGSEMNCFAVISNGEDKLPFMHPSLFPVFSILDPELTFTLPENQVANGIVDAFVHVLEQYLTYPQAAPLQDRMAESILQTLIEIGPETLAKPQDYDARASLVWCATLALQGLIGVGVVPDWSTHMIGHELTALFRSAHARSLAVVLPGTMRVRKEQKKEKLLQYGQRVWGIVEGSDDERIEAAIVKTEEFFNSLGVGTRLKDLGVTETDLDKIMANLEKHGMTALSERGDQTLDVSRRILEAVL